MPARWWRLPLVLALAAVSAAAVSLAGRLLVVADPLPPSTDAIVVLAGSIPTRVLEAADLYRAGLAPRVVVTRERLARGESVLRARSPRARVGRDRGRRARAARRPGPCDRSPAAPGAQHGERGAHRRALGLQPSAAPAGDRHLPPPQPPRPPDLPPRAR